MTPAELTVAEVLEKAADLLAEPEGWTQDAFAEDADGNSVPIDSPDATCFCIRGAIMKVSGERSDGDFQKQAAHLMLNSFERSALARWNDDDMREQAEVVTALRAAATKARQS